MNKEDYLQLVLQQGITKHNVKKAKQTASCNKYPQGYFKEKSCRICGKSFTPKAPSEHYCSDWCKDYAIVNAYYKRNYNISLKDYLGIAEHQNFVCAICHKENFAMNKCHSGVLVVDHDHKTGKVRGLLCHNCNRALGLLKDNKEIIQNCLSYLERVTTIPKGSTLK